MRFMLAAALIMLAGEAAAQRANAPTVSARPATTDALTNTTRPDADLGTADTRDADAALSTARTRSLERDARRAAAAGFSPRDVMRAYERDTRGTWLRRREIVVTAADSGAFAAAEALGLVEQRRNSLTTIGVDVVTYAAPDGANLRAAVRALRRAHPHAAIDYNYIFEPQGDGAVMPESALVAPRPLVGAATVAIIDGPIDQHAGAFATVEFTSQRFVRGPPAPSAHGDAVAAILARTIAASELRISAAYVIAAGPIESAAVDDIARGLDWAAGQGGGVINVSLTGPPSQTLAVIVHALSLRGCLVVAAAGNAGPRAAAPFPAALPQAIGVTAVDARGRIWRRATRGDHVDFAALGVNVEIDRDARVTGTSYATPLVSGLLARMLPGPDPALAAAAQSRLAERARDLGAPGRDPVYGLGLLSLQ